MESHPKYHEVADVCKQTPSRTRVLFQTFMDLKYVQLLRSVEARVVEGPKRPVITSRGLDSSFQVFVPVFADEHLSMDDLENIIEQLQVLLVESNKTKPMNNMLVHLAIVESDSTIVYYKIGQELSIQAIPLDK